jgi:ribonucleotide reductase beta subunit family protein with ferritin-like domain
LAFFAASDGIVNLNLAERFKKDIGILEATYFYDFQMMMENVHAQTYSLLLETIIPDSKERADLLNAIETIPVIAKMSQYMFKCIQSDAPLPERLLRMACVEGLFFTGCFCAIYWLQSRGLMPGLGMSNELIARDEGLHTMFAMFLYTLIEPQYKLNQAQVAAILTEAVDLAKEFILDALPNGLRSMNAQLMTDYIQCQADNLATLIDMNPIYGSTHDFPYMEQINLSNRTNFFERRVTEYGRKTEAEADDSAITDDF